MSKTRHPAEPLVRGYAVTHPGGRATLPDQGGWDRLVYTASGTVTVESGDTVWSVPPYRALWLPDGAPASVANRYPVAVRVLFFARHLRAAPLQARVIALDGFPRDLLLHAVRMCPLDDDSPGRRALLTLLTEQLAGQSDAGLDLRLPDDATTRSAADLLRAQPDVAIDVVASRFGLSRRTLERRFLHQTGISVGTWRRRSRVLDSLEHLAAGVPVTQTAIRVGYSTPSAFVAAFTRELGRSPRTFIRGD